MNYDCIPECKCGGTGSIVPNPSRPLNRFPCGDCIARFDRNHCAQCSKRLQERRFPSPIEEKRELCSVSCLETSRKRLQQQRASLASEIAVIDAKLKAIGDLEDAAVEAWHKSDTKLSLQEWLGMTTEEYADWI